MRIWSLHPQYLDAKGLVALWREALLAKKVLEGKTKGYKNHPQLNRFKSSKDPGEAINLYLAEVYKEALNRGYRFDPSKFSHPLEKVELTVTGGQVGYEFEHLLKKLLQRDPDAYERIKSLKQVKVHPLFRVVKGRVEDWEIL